MTVTTPFLQVQAAAFGYDPKKKPVIDHVSFSVAPGEFIVLRGPNGCGKSTIVKGILGLARTLDGSVHWNIDRTRAGYVPQETAVPNNLPYTAIDIVRCGVNTSSHRAKNAAQDALAAVGLREVRHLRYGDLSGGQKRRVLLARALIKKSPLFILDEPTANVDLQTERTIEAVIGDLTATNDIAVIAITHAADFGKKARELHIENRRLHE